MKLHLVTTGSYSDYRVDGIYSTAEKAAHAHKLYASDNPVAEYELDAIPDSPPGLLRYIVHMDKEGHVHWCDRVSAEYPPTEEWKPAGNGKTVMFPMWADDETHAIKIANERRTRLIAENKWTASYDEYLLLMEQNK